MKLYDLSSVVGLSVQSIADYLGISYVKTAKILTGEEKCPDDKKDKLIYFLTQNYTKCIDELLT